MDRIVGARLAAEAIIERGLKQVFSLSGGHITPIYQFLENSPVKIFATRHEQAAVFMAEATARLTRKPSLALVTAGPGFTNALTGVAGARLSNAPVVIIAGSVGLDTAEKLDLQDMNQLPVIAPLVKKALVCHLPERIPEFIDLAFRHAASGRPGPVYLEIPCDVLNAPVDPPRVKRYSTNLEMRPVDRQKAARIVDLLREAQFPLAIAGSGAWYSDAGEELKGLVETAGIPLFTLAAARGLLSDTHPLCFESSLAIRYGAAFFAHIRADLILFLGGRLSLFYIFGEIFRKEAKFIQVDIEPEEIGRSRSVDLGVAGDIRAVLEEVNRIIREKGIDQKLTDRFRPWVEELRKADAEGKEQARPLWSSENVPIHPLRLAQEINTFLCRKDDVVVADGGDTATWMGMTRTVRRAGHYLDHGLFGCLGVGIPYANAAKLLYPDKRVLLITGDGAVGFNFLEFHTAIRNNLPIVAVIANDQLWGMIAHSQQLRLGRTIKDGTELGLVRYERMVEALGGWGAFVESPGDIRPALEEAFASGKTACINVLVDPAVISPGSVALANLGGYRAG